MPLIPYKAASYVLISGSAHSVGGAAIAVPDPRVRFRPSCILLHAHNALQRRISHSGAPRQLARSEYFHYSLGRTSRESDPRESPRQSQYNLL